mgnify:CR=1 FL=1
MSKEEMHKILSEHLATFRAWSYAQLVERVERDRQAHDCLEHVEGIAPDRHRTRRHEVSDRVSGIVGRQAARRCSSLRRPLSSATPDVAWVHSSLRFGCDRQFHHESRREICRRA